MNEFIEQFLIEGRELVAQGSDDLLALEENPGDRERLDSAFRAFHTLKGAAGIVDFEAMAQALHAGEDVLSAVRSGAVVMTAALTDLCLACLDQVTTWMDQMQATGEVPADAQARADQIVRQFRLVSEAAGAGAEASPDLRPETSPDVDGQGGSLPQAARGILEEQLMLLRDAAPAGLAGRRASAVRVAARVLRAIDRASAAEQLENLAGATVPPESVGEGVADLLKELWPAAASQAGNLGAAPAETSVRVDVHRIDALVKLAGELTVAKNALGHCVRLIDEGESDPRQAAAELKAQHLRLERLVADLQRSVVALRVLPLQTAFQRFPRLVREMASALGKPARLMVEGAATEADKTIVSAISEPLLHVIRNSLDHGLETAAERVALGKPTIATIHLRALRQGEHIVIEVEDDGRGVDLDRVRAVAAERGVASKMLLDTMSDAEAMDLIFAPGFSTAAAVSDLSGRGVGMDVVRTTVERLGGRVFLTSRPGLGTLVRFNLPFTVMMTRVMTVEAGGQMFGLPLEAVVETVRVPRTAIASVGAARAFVLRNRTIPVIDLGKALGWERAVGAADAIIVVVSAMGQLGGLEVDRLGDRLDAMLTAPDGLLAEVPGIDGTTLMGDGRVLIVLDVREFL
ncbi:chemotaxis protein CheA [Reyranella sp.]|uniref:chemotaxis protein CheA n=1 Tax=Reyranella sp. TaxID=1929291 RepID=UPI003C7C6D0A